ncbi:MAG: MFS transporter [Prevotellaceae bacterium]|jgi:OPA family glycerol-3-phosphate transporter-like MFS transporter|nr:MFS transporter [Prevotellaceae bacterium]
MKFFQPPAHKPQIDTERVSDTYKRMRLKVFLGAFLGYAAYYLVRKNLSLAAPGMIADGLLDKASVGIAGSAISIAYAFSKFIMGSVSDRSDARKFLVVGLVCSALLMVGVGFTPFSAGSPAQNMLIIFVFMLLVGWLSGMGWPPCGRIMAHWFSQNERSFKMSVWNTSHTVGSGSLGLLATAGVLVFAALGVEQTWRAAFIFPALIALLLAVVCWRLLRDTPQSCGLPPIDEYRNDFSGKKSVKGEELKIPIRRLFVDYIFRNKILWLIAFANAFVYLVRYGIGDWAPVYLQEMGIMDGGQSNLAFSLHNYAGILGTIVCGWISAKFFKGRCAPANVIYMGLVLLGIVLYWQAVPLAAWAAQAFGCEQAAVCRALVYVSLCEIGFCIYGPVALIGIQALNLVPKNAAGTAAGFVGLFGYLLGDAVLAKIVMGSVSQSQGWNAAFWMFLVAGVLAVIFCASTWKHELCESRNVRPFVSQSIK